MAVPKKKTSVSRKGLRHAGQHHKEYAKSVVKCPTTGEFTLPHRVFQVDGTKVQKSLKRELKKPLKLNKKKQKILKINH